MLIGFIINTIPQREVDSVIFAFSSTNILHTKKKTEQKVEDISLKMSAVTQVEMCLFINEPCEDEDLRLTLRSPVPGKYSPYLWKDTVMTRSVV